MPSRYWKYLLLTLVLLPAPFATRHPSGKLPEQTVRRCIVSLPGNEPAKGLTEAMIRQFGELSATLPEIHFSEDGSPLDSLLCHRADLVVMPQPEKLPPFLAQTRSVSEDIAWIVRSDNIRELGQLNTFLADLTASEHFRRLVKLYYKGKIQDLSSISPYDLLVQEAAQQRGWDWRLISAIIYHESRFSLGANSTKGAVGLMQVRSKRYSEDSLLVPRINLEVGIRYLDRLEKMFSKVAADTTEQLKMALAAYNAGEGRIWDCIKEAERQQIDPSRWDNLVTVIPDVPHFKGGQTIAYVDSVLDTYAVYSRLYPR